MARGLFSRRPPDRQSRIFAGLRSRHAPVFDQALPESGQPLTPTVPLVVAASSPRGVLTAEFFSGGQVPIRVDAQGRVMRTPAIDRLILAARNGVHGRARSWLEVVDALREALYEVDREAELLGALVCEFSAVKPRPNISLATPSNSGGETRKPAITPAPGVETPARALDSADPVKVDRRCKK